MREPSIARYGVHLVCSAEPSPQFCDLAVRGRAAMGGMSRCRKHGAGKLCHALQGYGSDALLVRDREEQRNRFCDTTCVGERLHHRQGRSKADTLHGRALCKIPVVLSSPCGV